MPDKLTRWITQKKASELTARTLKAINELTRKKRFRTKRENDKTLVFTEDVLNYRPGRPGRPLKPKN